MDEKTTKALKDLHQRETDDLMGEQIKLDKVHATLPRTVEQLSEWSGIAPDDIITYAYRTKWLHDNMTISEVIGVLHTFFNTKRVTEQERNK